MVEMSLQGIVTVAAVGVPALLILLGFFAYLGGFTVATFTGDMEMKNTGMTMIIAGVALYILEFIAYVVFSYMSTQSSY